MTTDVLTLHSDSVNPQQSIYNPTLSFKNRSPEELASDPTGMVPGLLERLYEEQARLIEQRNLLLDNTFISLDPKQQDQLDNIDRRLDVVEADIDQISGRECPIDLEATEIMIEENKRWIQNMTHKIRSKK